MAETSEQLIPDPRLDVSEAGYQLSEMNRNGMIGLERTSTDRVMHALMNPMSARDVKTDIQDLAKSFKRDIEEDIQMMRYVLLLCLIRLRK